MKNILAAILVALVGATLTGCKYIKSKEQRDLVEKQELAEQKTATIQAEIEARQREILQRSLEEHEGRHTSTSTVNLAGPGGTSAINIVIAPPPTPAPTPKPTKAKGTKKPQDTMSPEDRAHLEEALVKLRALEQASKTGATTPVTPPTTVGVDPGMYQPAVRVVPTPQIVMPPAPVAQQPIAIPWQTAPSGPPAPRTGWIQARLPQSGMNIEIYVQAGQPLPPLSQVEEQVMGGRWHGYQVRQPQQQGGMMSPGMGGPGGWQNRHMYNGPRPMPMGRPF